METTERRSTATGMTTFFVSWMLDPREFSQDVTPHAYGAPDEVARAARAAVDQHAEDLDILANS
jgi:hypothetical protein